jgi:hypothetical protein
MNTERRVLRCAACKERIHPDQPGLILEDVATGRRRFFHQSSCAAAAYALAASRPGVYVLSVRHVQLAVN